MGLLSALFGLLRGRHGFMSGVDFGHGLAPSSGIYPRELNPADLSLISGPKTVPLLLTSDSCTALSCSLERSSGRKRLGGMNGFGIG